MSDLTVDLLDALPVESGPRAQRLLDLLRERGWSGWRIRPASFRTSLAHATRTISDPRDVAGP